ncbi:hypothetical protein FI667_g13334, partial [Globisporangium splendens]
MTLSQTQGKANQLGIDAPHEFKIAWQAPPSPDACDDAYDGEGTYEDEEDNHDVKQHATNEDKGDNDEEVAPPKKSPTPEAHSASGSPTNHTADKTSNRQPRKAALYVNNAVFFCDEETLREMKKSLQLEKQTLTHEFYALSVQLVAKEQLSAALKRELEELKTHVTLANLLGHVPVGSPASSSLSAPKMKSSRCVDLYAPCVQQKQHSNQQREKQRDQLQDTLNRVPRRDLCTLVDVQVKIAKLLEEKRALLENANSGTFGSPDDSEATAKVALEKELRKLELANARAKDEIREWKLQSERENARILPLQARCDKN